MKKFLGLFLAFALSAASAQTVVNPITSGLKSKYVTFTYNLATASGTQAVTGCGFQPTALQIIGFINATSSWGVGFADSGRTGSNITAYGATNSSTGATTPFEMFLGDGTGSNYVTGVINSYDSNGFTIGWTKNGSPTGTATWSVLCMQ